MLIHEKGPFIRGSILLISFLVLFCVLLTPVMRDEKGNHLTGLQYADNVFNELSKGSSYFIPSVREHVKTVEKTNVKVTVTMKKADLAETAVQVLTKAGMTASADGARVTYEGNLAAMLNAAMTARYDGTHALKAAAAWWYVLSPSIKELQKQRLIAEAQVVDQVLRRAVEPGNNFYSVEPVKVSDHIWLMSGMLIFYVIYTLWYGFAIFELFEGVGLAMTKSKVKQEG